jgi:hypothetical protein
LIPTKGVTDMPSQSAKSSIVKFAHRERAAKRPAHPDAKLINACIEYCMALSGAEAAFKTDPTDSHFAVPAAEEAETRAAVALALATKIEPITTDGLRAKAACVAEALGKCDNYLDEISSEFLLSLAADVIRFHRAANEQELHSTSKVMVSGT